MSETAPRATLRQNLRALPRDVWILYLGAFINRLGTFVLPFITLYLRQRGYSIPQAGLGIATYGIGAMVAQGSGGIVADRIGRRHSIALSMFGAAALTVSLVWVSGLWQIIAVVTLLGFVAELYRPASSALIADLVPSERRVAAFGAYRLTLNVGWAFGLALGGFLAQRSFNLLFVADAVTSAAFGVIAMAAIPHGVRTTKQEERHLSSARRSIAADKGMLLFLAAVLVTASVYMQNASTFALHITGLGHSYATYGLLQAMNGILVVIFELPIAAWTQHRPRTHMLALGSLFVGLGFATLTIFKSIPELMGFVAVWTFGEIVSSPPASAFVADRAPEHARGRYQGALGMMFASAAVLGPILGTLVYNVSPNALWIACGVVGAVAAGLALLAGRFPAPS